MQVNSSEQVQASNQPQQIFTTCHPQLNQNLRNPQSRDLLNYFSTIIKESSLSQTKLIDIKIQLCQQQTAKNAPQSNQTFIMASLLYTLVKSRRIRLIFSKYVSKVKKNTHSIKIFVTKNSINPSEYFFKCMQNIIDNYERQVGLASCHFNQITFQCEDSTIKFDTISKFEQMIRVRKDTYFFIQNFMKNLSLLYTNKKIYIHKLLLDCYSNKFYETSTFKQQYKDNSQQKYMLKHLTKQFKEYYIDLLIFKSDNYQNLKYFDIENNNEQLHLKEQNQIDQNQGIQENNEQFMKKNAQMGIFMDFKRSKSEYLSKIYLYFNNISNLTFLQNILPQYPNLTHFRLNNQATQDLILPNLDTIIDLIIKHNKYIQVFMFKKIRINEISQQKLQILFKQCPYLTQFQVNLPLAYSLDETFLESKSIDEKQRKQKERKLIILLTVMRLRNITINHHLQMAKLFMADGYNQLSIIELIDSYQPLLF